MVPREVNLDIGVFLYRQNLSCPLLSLQETLCGCRPKVLGNLRNECSLYFIKVDQWDKSIQLMAFKHENDKQIDSALKD
jgi:hypothetical protein